ncbi:hypothetical protein HMPREF9124_1730 [Oribacterium sp. oral taxon 108 str. F0425]|nr:hypothetical protein HMPREF9124_1730 [Oribacterium sp. oral taxon 108 str. F0425]
MEKRTAVLLFLHRKTFSNEICIQNYIYSIKSRKYSEKETGCFRINRALFTGGIP